VKINVLTSGLCDRFSRHQRTPKTQANPSIAIADLWKTCGSDRSISVHIGRIRARL